MGLLNNIDYRNEYCIDLIIVMIFILNFL